jgi:[ribosomal protein S5]-alanine N-acetyltransferase
MLTLDFNPFPIMDSERLYFRSFHEDDVHEVFAMRSDKEVMKYIPRPLAKNISDALDHIKMVKETIEKKEGINWAITLKGQSQLIGIIGIYRIKNEDHRGELGYILLPEYHNKGYISEAIQTVLTYAFETIGFHSLEAIIDPANIASERVLIKNGFVKEGHIKENVFWDGQYLDTVIYSMLRRNFKN